MKDAPGIIVAKKAGKNLLSFVPEHPFIFACAGVLLLQFRVPSNRLQCRE